MHMQIRCSLIAINFANALHLYIIIVISRQTHDSKPTNFVFPVSTQENKYIIDIKQ
jgi:hypothetical protein